MATTVISLASERLVRRAPATPVPLTGADVEYIIETLKELEEAFAVTAVPVTPLHVLPGRVLMRHLIDLRGRLRPASLEQRLALGRLSGAILRLDTACAFVRAREDRRSVSGPDENGADPT